jgi:hypothetical protein
MRSQGWVPVKLAPDGTVCATCENPLDPGDVNYRRAGMISERHSALYYCCHDCAAELYEDEGDELDDEDLS